MTEAAGSLRSPAALLMVHRSRIAGVSQTSFLGVQEVMTRSLISVLGSGAVLLVGCQQTPVSVDSTELRLGVAVTPTSAAATPSGQSVQVVVSVTNPSNRSVVVQLGGPPYKSGQIPAAETNGIGFGIRVLRPDNIGPSEWTWGQPTFSFAPHQTLRHTFAIRVVREDVGGLVVTPGSYNVIASFGRQAALPIALVVAP